MRTQTTIGVALGTLATAVLAQVADPAGRTNTGNIQVDQPSPAANVTVLANQSPPASDAVRSNSTAVEEATSPNVPPSAAGTTPRR